MRTESGICILEIEIGNTGTTGMALMQGTMKTQDCDDGQQCFSGMGRLL
jgi:hypothetical protein